MPEHVLTLDLGSSALRAAVVTPDWRLASECVRPYNTPAHDEPDFPEALRAIVLKCLAEAISEAKIRPDEISRVAISAQRGGVAFVDAAGKTLRIHLNSDTRAVFQGAAIDDRLGPEIFATTGHLPSMFLAPAKLHWWREADPRLAQRFTTIATLGSWAAHALSGVFAETASTLVEAGLADVTTGRPAAALLAKQEFSLDALPPLVPEGAVVGQLTPEAAHAIGLPVGTPVALAGPDTQVATLGAGGANPGDTVVVAGWSAPVQRVTLAPAFDAERRTWVGRHPLADHWVAEANPGDTGRTLETVRDMLDPAMTLAQFDQVALVGREDVDKLLPVIAAWGPRALNMSNLGLSLGGLITPAPITYDSPGRPAIAFATIENIGFAIRECIALLDDVTKSQVNALLLTGGMAVNPQIALILAEAIGHSVRLQPPRATAIGAALVSTLAGNDQRSAAADVASRAQPIEPNLDLAERASERYERWLRVRKTLDQLAEEI
jgi:sugar (pentulose or hexulose) kinase